MIGAESRLSVANDLQIPILTRRPRYGRNAREISRVSLDLLRQRTSNSGPRVCHLIQGRIHMLMAWTLPCHAHHQGLVMTLHRRVHARHVGVLGILHLTPSDLPLRRETGLHSLNVPHHLEVLLHPTHDRRGHERVADSMSHGVMHAKLTLLLQWGISTRITVRKARLVLSSMVGIRLPPRATHSLVDLINLCLGMGILGVVSDDGLSSESLTCLAPICIGEISGRNLHHQPVVWISVNAIPNRLRKRWVVLNERQRFWRNRVGGRTSGKTVAHVRRVRRVDGADSHDNDIATSWNLPNPQGSDTEAIPMRKAEVSGMIGAKVQTAHSAFRNVPEHRVHLQHASPRELGEIATWRWGLMCATGGGVRLPSLQARLSLSSAALRARPSQMRLRIMHYRRRFLVGRPIREMNQTILAPPAHVRRRPIRHDGLAVAASKHTLPSWRRADRLPNRRRPRL